MYWFPLANHAQDLQYMKVRSLGVIESDTVLMNLKFFFSKMVEENHFLKEKCSKCATFICFSVQIGYCLKTRKNENHLELFLLFQH